MNIIICVDDDGGIAFNNRRQSCDKELTRRICEMTKDGILWISHYSEELFSCYDNAHINVDDRLLEEAASDDYCFIECNEIKQYEKRINKLILVKWNRQYPSDKKLEIDFSKYRLELTEDFIGNSHNKITLEVYIHETK